MIYNQMTYRSPEPDPYLKQKVFSASPEQLILYAFEIGLTACKRKDKTKAMQAVQELTNSLNYDHKEIAVNFYRMYQYILKQIRNNNLDEAAGLLQELRDTWAQAFKLK